MSTVWQELSGLLCQGDVREYDRSLPVLASGVGMGFMPGLEGAVNEAGDIYFRPSSLFFFCPRLCVATKRYGKKETIIRKSERGGKAKTKSLRNKDKNIVKETTVASTGIWLLPCLSSLLSF